jgi:hypothetical protein
MVEMFSVSQISESVKIILLCSHILFICINLYILIHNFYDVNELKKLCYLLIYIITY